MGKKNVKIKKPGWLAEFKEFAINGNAMALSVAAFFCKK